MKRIGLISDTHGHFEESISKYFDEVDEIWHAGDIGHLSVMERLAEIAPTYGVYGNIDDQLIRAKYPRDWDFECEGVSVFMTHIGGYPGRYNKRVSAILKERRPKLYISGHSHILKVMYDKSLGLLHINPGAAGIHGFHQVKTIVRFTLDQGDIKDLDVVELAVRK